MRKNLLYVIFTVMFFSFSYGQNLWKKVPEEKLSQLAKMDRAATPGKYELFSLDFEALKTQLTQAPLDSQGIQSDLVVAFPTAEGKLNNYQIYEAPVMEAALANKYPDIKSYVGKGIDDPTATIRFSVTLFGLHTMTLSGTTGTSYIDTYTKDLKNYIVYDRKDLIGSRTFSCQVEDDHDKVAQQYSPLLRSNDSRFRTYRMAMACTIEYAAFHVTAAGLGAGTVAQKKAAVLAAMNVTMTRVNAIYERDLAVRMTLVANNDVLIFITTDSFNNTNATTLIAQSQNVINAAIGAANYDIGHTVSTGGGGLAGLGVVCDDTQKARGITGSPSPVGDPYDIDYVAHEVGHQFGANHTFNGDGGSCTGNRNNGTAVEPGSGSTIMAYAGICPGVDVQPNSDAHFHTISLGEIFSHITGAGNCAAFINNANTPPVANAGLDYTIPKGTAFILKGAATDANGDALTYCWEQTNNQVSTQPPVSTSTTGPNFRSNPPTISPNRYMPTFSKVLEGNLAPTWEVVPTVARTLNFALTVRDNRAPNGGQTSRDNMIVTVGNTTGPFAVTSQPTGVTWTQGATETITWNVVGTTAAPYNSPNVNILISTDNGATFTTLVANTPNDGSQVITVPSTGNFPFCRIMVESIGNIFYAINAGNIAIGYTVVVNTTCNTYTATPAATIVEQAPLAYQTFSVAVPAMAGTISDVNVSTNISHRVNQLYLGMNHPDLTFVQLFQADTFACADTDLSMITTFDDAGAAFACAGAAGSNTFKPVAPLSVLNGKTAAGTWRFRVADITVGESGTLNSYSFNICTKETIVTLATESFGLQDFTLYPNPNNGSFTVKFNSNSSNDIKVGVHDMRGRQIFNKSYQNEGLFNQNLQLERVQAGVYLVTVQDGDRKEVKRIVVE